MTPKLVQAFGRWNVLASDGSKVLDRWGSKEIAEKALAKEIELDAKAKLMGLEIRRDVEMALLSLAPPEEDLDPEIRGARARALTQDPVFVEAVAKHRDDLMRAWAHTEPEQSAAREAAYYELRGLNAAVRKLDAFVRDARAEALKRQKAAG